jgi:hypothetical protein
MMNPKEGFVIELAEGRVKEGVEPQEYLRASDNLMADLNGLEGYIRRELWQGEDGRFVDIVYWESLESAQRAAEIFPSLPSAQPFEALLDISSLSMRHLKQIRVYDREEISDGRA